MQYNPLQAWQFTSPLLKKSGCQQSSRLGFAITDCTQTLRRRKKMLLTLCRFTKRLCLLSMAALLLSAMPAVAQAAVCFLGNSEAGGTLWLSCGSSAGDTVWLCSASGSCTVLDGDGGATLYCLMSGCGGGYITGLDIMTNRCDGVPNKPGRERIRPTTPSESIANLLIAKRR